MTEKTYADNFFNDLDDYDDIPFELDNVAKNRKIGRTKCNLTETQIRYAMENTSSCLAAARFLRISYRTYKLYASQYIDDKTGKTLFELHKNQGGAGQIRPLSSDTKKRIIFKRKIKTQDILDGKHRELKNSFVQKRYIKDGYLIEQCYKCGFAERRVTDRRMPLVINFLDGDNYNYKLDNVELLCYNCYFLFENNIKVIRNRKVKRY